jgi:allophanate hydrolase
MPGMALDALGFDLASLRAAYAAGTSARAVLAEVRRRIGNDPQNAWLQVLEPAALEPYLQRLEQRGVDLLPLYGVPFAIKDNIDLAGVATTAGCPQFAYQPPRSAFVVERLVAAGAVPVGKTNLDQFATGLNGTRSPFGPCSNAFDHEYIAGGSSSGSAVAVALGQVSFALGTDTAGSGRVPAAFNNVVGLKPTRGLLSTRGVVPCCRSLDCVSLFGLTATDLAQLLDVVEAFDGGDPWSRTNVDRREFRARPEGLRVGVPTPQMLQFFGAQDAEAAFAAVASGFAALGATLEPLDLAHFREAAELLYGGAWVAERYSGIRSFFESQPEALLPVTREIIGAALRFTAADAFDALQRLQELRRPAARTFEQVDCLLLPTAPRLYTIAELQADPVTLNSNLGYYTNFMNLLDLAGVAVPAALLDSGLPFGVTLCAPAGHDRALLRLAARWQAATGLPLGATGRALPACAEDRVPAASEAAQDRVLIAVCGAHMQGLPLNAQLTQRGGRLVRLTTTAPLYRLHALPGGPPRKPGLVRAAVGGSTVELELWDLPLREFGSLVAGIPAPLGIGRITLQDGSSVSGFLCEAAAIANALDISAYGGWRAWLQASGAGA